MPHRRSNLELYYDIRQTNVQVILQLSYYETLLFKTLTKKVTESTLSTQLICLLLLSDLLAPFR